MLRVRAPQEHVSCHACPFVVLEGFSRMQGPAATFGRNLTGEVAGLAATSHDKATLEGVGRILSRFLEDQSHPFSILAQGLLAEKIRCGAASEGDDALVASISKAVNPDKEFDFASTYATVAERYGIHPHADLYSVAARSQRVAAVGYAAARDRRGRRARARTSPARAGLCLAGSTGSTGGSGSTGLEPAAGRRA